MRVSTRGEVAPFHVMELFKAAAARQARTGDVITLCAGQPATSAASPVLAAAHAALDADPLGYTETGGIFPLRQAIAEHYATTYATPIDPAHVMVTTGSSGAFTAVFLAAFEVGDTVVMARPGYPAYRNTLSALGARVVELDCGPETRFQPTLEMLQALPEPPAGLIIASPANPTGTILEADELSRIALWCKDNDVLLISDEIYHGVTYGRECASALEFSDAAVVIGSFSKYFSMTGWRIGWAILPEPLARPTELLLGNLNICAPGVAQAACVAAFTEESRAELQGHVQRYAANRDLLLQRLPQMGLGSFAPPDGAFYIYADISHLTSDSLSWCHEILDRTGVALAPGIDFAPARPEGPPAADGRTRVRLSFAGDTHLLGVALDRLEAAL